MFDAAFHHNSACIRTLRGDASEYTVSSVLLLLVEMRLGTRCSLLLLLLRMLYLWGRPLC